MCLVLDQGNRQEYWFQCKHSVNFFSISKISKSVLISTQRREIYKYIFMEDQIRHVPVNTCKHNKFDLTSKLKSIPS